MGPLSRSFERGGSPPPFAVLVGTLETLGNLLLRAVTYIVQCCLNPGGEEEIGSPGAEEVPERAACIQHLMPNAAGLTTR